MQSFSYPKTAKALARPLQKKQPRKPDFAWKPQPGSLTREELRAIIIDQIG